jgi:hypothetical protein
VEESEVLPLCRDRKLSCGNVVGVVDPIGKGIAPVTDFGRDSMTQQ